MYWLQGYPALTKSAEEIKKALPRFLGPGVKPTYVYSDNSKENIKAFDDLGYLADFCRPHRSETNGIAERSVRRVTEGTRAVLAQSGLHDSV